MSRMKTKFLLLICLVFPLALSAQKVNLLTVDQLEQRLKSGKDTVFIVNFWATWCAPCIEELPYFERFSTAKKQELVRVLLISLDFKSKMESSVKPFVKKMNLHNDVYLLNEKNQQTYIDRIDKNWSGAIPATLIISPKLKSRQLIEKQLTYQELLTFYQKNKSDE